MDRSLLPRNGGNGDLAAGDDGRSDRDGGDELDSGPRPGAALWLGVEGRSVEASGLDERSFDTGEEVDDGNEPPDGRSLGAAAALPDGLSREA